MFEVRDFTYFGVLGLHMGVFSPPSLLFLLHLFPSEQQWRNLEEKEKKEN